MYKVSQGVFVDGAIADAEDFLNEFGAVATELASMNTELNTKILENASASTKYTDDQLDSIEVDGGTF